MYILGISAFYHDSAAALIKGDEIIAAAQEERFTRKKQDPSFPVNAVRYCLDYAGISLAEVEAVVFYDKPFLKFERLLETYYAFAPRGLKSFLSSIPVWIKEKVMLKRLLLDELSAVGNVPSDRITLLFPEHHLSHAASAFFPSPYEEAAILTIDGVGEWTTASISHGKGNSITILKELKFPHSLGLLYSAFTYYLGFKVNSGEYKLMGLAPYGNPVSGRVERFVELIKTHLVEIRDDGSLWLNQEYFDYATGLKMTDNAKWETLFGFPRRGEESELMPEHCDLGLAIQQVCEEVVLKMAREAKRLTGARYACPGRRGGAQLRRQRQAPAQRHLRGYLDPAGGRRCRRRPGGSPGGLLPDLRPGAPGRRPDRQHEGLLPGAGVLRPGHHADRPQVQGGIPEVSTPLPRSAVRRPTTWRTRTSSAGSRPAWSGGRGRWATAASSPMPAVPEMQRKLNLKIKYREGFRPFAPSVMIECEAGVLRLHHPLALHAAGGRRGRRSQEPAPGGVPRP